MRTARLLAGILLLALTTAAWPADLLAPHRGRDRVILVFAPAGDDPRLAALAADRAELACEIANRQVVIEVVAGVAPGRSEALRRAFEISDGDFVALLVGKDGGQKARSSGQVDLPGMLRLIDTMPMRRAERAGDRDCGRPAPPRQESGG